MSTHRTIMAYTIPNPISNTRPPTSFYFFSYLREDVQECVSMHAFPIPRRISLDIFRYYMPRRSVLPPASSCVSKAAREFTFKHYKVLWEWVDFSFYLRSSLIQPLFFSPTRDVMTLDFSTLVRSDWSEFAAAHERVVFLLCNNSHPQIVREVEVLELYGVGTSLLEINDIAVVALGILEHFGGLKDLRLLGLPTLARGKQLKKSCWVFRRVVLRLVFCFAISRSRGLRVDMPKMLIDGKDLDLQEEYEGYLSALEEGSDLE